MTIVCTKEENKNWWTSVFATVHGSREKLKLNYKEEGKKLLGNQSEILFF
jgi:hypothetical protein